MATHTQSANGLQFSRRLYPRRHSLFFDQFEYDYRSSVIRNPSGEIVFEMTNVEVPKGWSQIATISWRRNISVRRVYHRLTAALAARLQ